MKKRRVLFGGIILAAMVGAGAVTVRPQVFTTATGAALIAGRNVNMVAGTKLPWGDPWLQRQNEPSIAVSSRNPLHLFAGANDYRTIDMPDLANQKVPGLPVQIAAARDAWLGIFKSFDGGQSWITSLVPGYPQDNSADGTASPIHGYDTACDPCVRAGANGLFFMSGIAFNRSRTGGSVFVARFMDNNNLEKVQRDSNGRPSRDSIEYVDTKAISAGNAGLFLDMPSLAVDIPRAGLGTSVVEGQTIPNARVYLAYTVFPGSTAKNVRSKLYLARSTNSGRTWLMPIKVSESQQIIQRAVVAVDPHDPTGKTVYVAYRRFLLDVIPDAIVVVKSVDGGATFSKPVVISTLPNPFDQLMNENRFRTNTYPTIAVDQSGIVYVAWAERRAQDGARSAGGQARIVVATSANGLVWNTPQVVELQDENGVLDGHQVMPSLSYAGGKLMLVWYDQRGTLAKEVTPNAVTTYFEDSPGLYRQTVDVRAASIEPGLSPGFFRSIQVSRYLFYLVLGADGEPELENGFYKLVQAEYNPINYPLFQLGTRPFHGDFLDLAASPSIIPPPLVNGTAWGLNTDGERHPTSFHAAWTDNRDVRPPYPDWWGDWSNYYPPNSQQPDPALAQTFPCPGGSTTGMRNQNVYTASLSDGLHVGSPGNTKPLNIAGGTPGGRRTFVVFLRDLKGDGVRSFTLSFDGTISGPASASFMQNGDQDTRGVTLGPYSSASITVYVDENDDAMAPVKVDIREIPGNSLAGYVVLNPDRTNLAVELPDNPASDLEEEEHTPRVSDPKIWKYDMGGADPHPGAENPRVQNPRVHNSGLVNPRVQNQSLENPRVQNKTLTNENIVNSETGNPRVQNPRVQNTALTDMTWTVTNDGNTTSGFQFDAVSNTGTLAGYFNSDPPALFGQLLVYKVHTTPLDQGCELQEEHHDELVVNVTNPRVMNPRVQNSTLMTQGKMAVQTESTSDPEPDITDSDATFWLAPGEEAYVILKVYDPDTTDGIDFDPQMVAAEVEAEAVDTESTSPDPVIVTQPTVPWDPNVVLPAIGFSPGGMTLKAVYGVSPGPRSLDIWNSGGGTIAYAVSDNAAWLSVTPGAGTSASSSQTVNHTISFDTVGLPADTYRTEIIISDPYAVNNPARVSVTVVVGEQGSPYQLAFGQQPIDTAVGASIPTVTVEIQDIQGNRAPNATNVVTLSLLNSQTATLSGTLSRAAVGGIATFNDLSIDKIGQGYSLRANSGSLTEVDSSPFNVVPGPLDHFEFSTITSPQIIGAPFSITIAAKDAGGNSVTSYAGTNTLSGAISQTLTGAFAGGSWTGDVTPTAVGTGVQISTSGGGKTGQSNAFDIIEGIIFITQPTGTVVGHAIYPAVRVQTMPGATVSMAIGSNPSNGILSGTTTAVTTTEGIAQFSNLSIASQGVGYTLVATATIPGLGNFNATSVAFDILPTTQLTFVVQPTQTVVNGIITPSVVVRAEDDQGAVLPGLVIELEIGSNPSGGTLSPAPLINAVTNATGEATFSGLSIDTAGDGYTLRARLTILGFGYVYGVSIPFNVVSPNHI